MKAPNRIALFACGVFLLTRQTAFAQIETSLSDDQLLEKIQHRVFQYFVVEKNPENGLIRDRAHNFVAGSVQAPASIAATGFALSAYPVAVERGWMDRPVAYELTRRTLEFFLSRAETEHGFFYHFLDMRTGKRFKRAELSVIDTAILVAGVLTAARYFEEPGLLELARKIYERVEWPWMLQDKKTFALAWTPETGFHSKRWDHFDESILLYLLAMGSPTYPVPPSSWRALARPAGSYADFRLMQMPPLFTHQYPHLWFDLRNSHDDYADYFENSRRATLANRQFAIDEAAHFSTYGPNSWGLTASDGPFGYRAYGAPPGWADHDGTVAPTACGASIMFTPAESLACLRHLYEKFGDRLWGRYGFSDAFNLDKKWFSQMVIGIDQGALLLAIENYRSGLIWEIMKKEPSVQRGIQSAGFRSGSREVDWPDPPVHEAIYVPAGIGVDGYLNDWPPGKPILLDVTHRESGALEGEQDVKGEIRFAWDDNHLYFYAKVFDDQTIRRRQSKGIWQDDLVELYVDPQSDGLFWYNEADFQIGFQAPDPNGQVGTWSWFQKGEDPREEGWVLSAGFLEPKGYLIEGAIRWFDLGIRPREGIMVSLSPAIHDVDRDGEHGKLQWFFRNEEKYQRFTLGKLKLTKRPGDPL